MMLNGAVKFHASIFNKSRKRPSYQPNRIFREFSASQCFGGWAVPIMR